MISKQKVQHMHMHGLALSVNFIGRAQARERPWPPAGPRPCYSSLAVGPLPSLVPAPASH